MPAARRVLGQLVARSVARPSLRSAYCSVLRGCVRLGMGSEPIGSTGLRIEFAVEGSVERSTSDWGEELLHPKGLKGAAHCRGDRAATSGSDDASRIFQLYEALAAH